MLRIIFYILFIVGLTYSNELTSTSSKKSKCFKISIELNVLRATILWYKDFFLVFDENCFIINEKEMKPTKICEICLCRLHDCLFETLHFIFNFTYSNISISCNDGRIRHVDLAYQHDLEKLKVVKSQNSPDPDQFSGYVSIVIIDGQSIQQKPIKEMCDKDTCYDGTCHNTYPDQPVCLCNFMVGKGQHCIKEDLQEKNCSKEKNVSNGQGGREVNEDLKEKNCSKEKNGSNGQDGHEVNGYKIVVIVVVVNGIIIFFIMLVIIIWLVFTKSNLSRTKIELVNMNRDLYASKIELVNTNHDLSRRNKNLEKRLANGNNGTVIPTSIPVEENNQTVHAQIISDGVVETNLDALNGSKLEVVIIVPSSQIHENVSHKKMPNMIGNSNEPSCSFVRKESTHKPNNRTGPDWNNSSRSSNDEVRSSLLESANQNCSPAPESLLLENFERTDDGQVDPDTSDHTKNA